MESLVDDIERVLAEVDSLETRYRAGRAHETVLARLAFVHAQLRLLESELAGLLEDTRANPDYASVWAATQAELRAAQPGNFAAPAQELIAGDLDLLRLVEYTAASIARVQERRAALGGLRQATWPPE